MKIDDVEPKKKKWRKYAVAIVTVVASLLFVSWLLFLKYMHPEALQGEIFLKDGESMDSVPVKGQVIFIIPDKTYDALKEEMRGIIKEEFDLFFENERSRQSNLNIELSLMQEIAYIQDNIRAKKNSINEKDDLKKAAIEKKVNDASSIRKKIEPYEKQLIPLKDEYERFKSTDWVSFKTDMLPGNNIARPNDRQKTDEQYARRIQGIEQYIQEEYYNLVNTIEVANASIINEIDGQIKAVEEELADANKEMLKTSFGANIRPVLQVQQEISAFEDGRQKRGRVVDKSICDKIQELVSSKEYVKITKSSSGGKFGFIPYRRGTVLFALHLFESGYCFWEYRVNKYDKDIVIDNNNIISLSGSGEASL